MNPKLVEIAKSQIGTQEDPAHTNKGAAIRKYQEATNLAGQGWPWCAAFVDWCIAEYALTGGIDAKKIPRTASAFGLIEWGKKQGCEVITEAMPEPGDIVVYTFSHCGIVSRLGDAGTLFYAIEGNTNAEGGRDGYAVAERGRNLKAVKAFIRIKEESNGLS